MTAQKYRGGIDVSHTSVGELLGEITRDMSTLLRQEVELAKVELRQESIKAGKSAGMFGAAAVAGYMVLLFLSIALWWGLSNVMDQSWAALIVAVVWAVVAAITYPMARNRLRTIRGMPQTAETVKKVPGALKGSPAGGERR